MLPLCVLAEAPMPPGGRASVARSRCRAHTQVGPRTASRYLQHTTYYILLTTDCRSTEDILKVRDPTRTIETLDFQYGKAKFRVIDVGGQRMERPKWNLTGEITAVIFVCALTEYNQVPRGAPPCTRGANAVHMRCTCGAHAVHMRCTRSAHAVHTQCTCGAHAVHRRHALPSPRRRAVR